MLTEGRRSTAISVAFAALVVIAALALAACGGSSTTASNSPNAATSLVAGQSQGASPLPAPTVTGTIAFSKVVKQGANSEICVVNADGTGLTQLTDDPEYEEHPAWSPDGRRIVYTKYPRKRNGTWFDDLSVWVMNADGSGKKELTQDPFQGFDPTWSPNGKQIALNRLEWVKKGAFVDVFVMNADGSGLKLVTTAGPVVHVVKPDWAPDGKIFFLKEGDLYAVDPEGGGPARLTKGENVRDFALSPDGKTIAIYDTLWDRVEAFATRGGGTRTTLLDPVGDFITGNWLEDKRTSYANPAWSPDGKALALASSNDGVPRGSRLYIVNADGSGLSAVPGIETASDPAWRPE
jgi:Tol biopolymer transport system component